MQTLDFSQLVAAKSLCYMKVEKLASLGCRSLHTKNRKKWPMIVRGKAMQTWFRYKQKRHIYF